MSEPVYARDTATILHRVLSLVVALGLLVLEAMVRDFVTLRTVGVYLSPLAVIWFPEVVAGYDHRRAVRISGWVCLVGVPLWFLGLRWLTW